MMMKGNQRELLIVCNEPALLGSMQQSFKNMSYRVHTAKTGVEALCVLQMGHSIGMVITDLHVPEMDGFDLLVKVREHRDSIITLLLVEPSDGGNILKVINSPAVFKILLKPISEEHLLRLADRMFLYRELVLENQKLGLKLKTANDELMQANKDLERRIREKAEELINAVYYDALTGLPSSVLTKDLVGKAVENAKYNNAGVSVFMIGLDRFKFINDSLGHEAGDEVLVEVANRLNRHFQSSDIVARISSDVFSVVLTEPELYADAGSVAQELLEIISEPLRVNGKDIFLTASIGISRYPQDGKNADRLMANAETAMRQVKIEERNSYGCYSGEINQRAGERLSLESDLRRAVEHNEFVLHYQPRFDLDSARITGVEALLRWKHPARGLVPPLEFLPLLEETGLIKPVGEWILSEACSALSRWRAKNFSDLQLAINLSARQFRDPNLANVICRIAEDNGVASGLKNIEFEITESVVMEDVIRTRNILRLLHEMGVEIAIDDFGTGYSSLSYLIQFPLDYLKIDKSFVSDVINSKDARAIVEALISLGYSLRLKVIAEGVENVEQLKILYALGCRQFQGFLFSKPLPENELIEILLKDAGESIVFDVYQKEPINKKILLIHDYFSKNSLQ